MQCNAMQCDVMMQHPLAAVHECVALASPEARRAHERRFPDNANEPPRRCFAVPRDVRCVAV